MPRGPLEVRIQAISAAYHYIHRKEQKIKEFCDCLRRAGESTRGRMYWHPETNERHGAALEALERVADDLRRIRGEVKLTSEDPKVVKMESMKRMDEYLVRFRALFVRNNLVYVTD